MRGFPGLTVIGTVDILFVVAEGQGRAENHILSPGMDCAAVDGGAIGLLKLGSQDWMSNGHAVQRAALFPPCNKQYRQCGEARHGVPSQPRQKANTWRGRGREVSEIRSSS